MAVDLLQLYGINPSQSSQSAAPSVDLLDLYGVNSKQATQPEAKDPGFFTNLAANAIKPVDNLFLGGIQLGSEGAAKVGLISPETNQNVQSVLQQMHQSAETNYPSDTVSGVLGQVAGYGALGAGVQGAAAGAAPEMAQPLLQSPTLGGALSRIGIAGGTNAALGAANYVDPDKGLNRVASATLAGLGGVVGQGIGEGVSGAVNLLNRSADQKLIEKVGSSAANLISKKDDILNNISDVQDKVTAGEMAGNALLKYESQLKNNYKDLYNAAAGASGQDTVVADANAAKTYFDMKDRFGSKLSPDIIRNIEKYSLFSPNGQSPLTVNNAIKLAQDINEDWRSTTDLREKLALGKINQSLYDAIDSVGAQSPAVQAYSAARDARIKYNDIFQQKNLIEDIIDKKSKSEYLLQPEQLINKISQGAKPLHNIQLIKQVLQEEGSPDSQQAWGALQRHVIQERLINPSMPTDNTWNSQAFLRNYKKLGDRFINEVADNPELAGQLKLLKASSQYNLDSSKLISTKVLNLLKKHAGKLTLGILGAGYGEHMMGGEEATSSKIDNLTQPQDYNQ